MFQKLRIPNLERPNVFQDLNMLTQVVQYTTDHHRHPRNYMHEILMSSPFDRGNQIHMDFQVEFVAAALVTPMMVTKSGQGSANLKQ